MQGYAESYATTDSRRTRVCRVSLGFREAFLSVMIGGSLRVTRAGAPAISRWLPDRRHGAARGKDLSCVGADFLFGMEPGHATQANNDPRAFPNAELSFGKLVYAVHYATRPFDLKADDDPLLVRARRRKTAGETTDVVDEMYRYVERTVTQAVEAVAIPGGPYKFVGTTVPLNEPPPKALPTSEVTMTWWHVPAECVPVAAINTCRGKVNDRVFDSEARASRWPFRAYAVGTMLLTAVDYRSYVDPFGSEMIDVIYKFAERNSGDAAEGGGVKAGWNHVYRATTGEWLKVTHDGTAAGRTIYQTADFNGLFTPA